MVVRDLHAYATALSSTNILNRSDVGGVWKPAKSGSHSPVMCISRSRKARTASSRLKKRDAQSCSVGTGTNHEDISHLLTMRLGSDTDRDRRGTAAVRGFLVQSSWDHFVCLTGGAGKALRFPDILRTNRSHVQHVFWSPEPGAREGQVHGRPLPVR